VYKSKSLNLKFANNFENQPECRIGQLSILHLELSTLIAIVGMRQQLMLTLDTREHAD